MNPLSLIVTPREMPLARGIVCHVWVDPVGIDPPHEGDSLRVAACMGLPAEQDTRHYLDERLQFGDRLKIMGDPLNGFWGRYDQESGLRVGHVTFAHDTWEKAIDAAEEYVVGEAAALKAALDKRAAALCSEGSDYVAVRKLLGEGP